MRSWKYTRVDTSSFEECIKKESLASQISEKNERLTEVFSHKVLTTWRQENYSSQSNINKYMKISNSITVVSDKNMEIV